MAIKRFLTLCRWKANRSHLVVLGLHWTYLLVKVANIMTKSLDFFSENWASRGAKTNFLSFLIRELLPFEFAASNRSPWAINQKILPGPNRVKIWNPVKESNCPSSWALLYLPIKPKTPLNASSFGLNFLNGLLGYESWKLHHWSKINTNFLSSHLFKQSTKLKQSKLPQKNKIIQK